MKLAKNQLAPDFVTEDINGNPIRLSDYTNKKLMLSFFRYAGCPFCNLTLQGIIKRYENLSSRGLNVIAFFQSEKSNILDYPNKQNPPFPLVADPDKKIYDLYGVESSIAGTINSLKDMPYMYKSIVDEGFKQGKMDGDAFLMPADFLISSDKPESKLVIKNLHYATSFADKIPFIDIETFLLLD